MDRPKLQLWFAYPDDLHDEATARACERLLSEDERARWKRFKFERHQREYLATRALQRVALSAIHPTARSDWQFELNAQGKPSTQQAAGRNFNLSNSLGLVVCLVGSGGEVGVDVEPFERARQIAEVAPRFFSPREQQQLEGLRGDEKLDRALSFWTLKEAYIKARGMGMALPLDQFSFLFESDESIRLEMDASLADEPGRWRFCLLNHAEHRVALMAEATVSPELEIWEARPLLGEPTRVEDSGMRWFPLG